MHNGTPADTRRSSAWSYLAIFSSYLHSLPAQLIYNATELTLMALLDS